MRRPGRQEVPEPHRRAPWKNDHGSSATEVRAPARTNTSPRYSREKGDRKRAFMSSDKNPRKVSRSVRSARRKTTETCVGRETPAVDQTATLIDDLRQMQQHRAAGSLCATHKGRRRSTCPETASTSWNTHRTDPSSARPSTSTGGDRRDGRQTTGPDRRYWCQWRWEDDMDTRNAGPPAETVLQCRLDRGRLGRPERHGPAGTSARDR